jgi:hypothetical protein
MGVAKQVSEVGLELSKLPRLLVGWGAALVQSQEKLAPFSGAIAQATGIAQQREIGRMMESGARTGGTTAELSRSLQDLYDRIAPMSDGVTNILNRSVTTGVQMLTRAVELLDLMWKGMVKLDERATGFLKILDETAKIEAKWAEREGRGPFLTFAEEVLKRDVFGPKPVEPRQPPRQGRRP